MLTERKALGKIEILEDGSLQIREDTIIERDGEEIARTYHRRTLAPTDAPEPDVKRVQDVARILWTPDVVKAYREKRAAADILPKVKISGNPVQ